MENIKRRLKKSLGMVLVFVLSLWLTAPLLAQQETVGLRMEVDKRQVEVGDSITLTVEFKQVASGNASVMGEPQIPASDHFEARGQQSFTQVSVVNQQTVATTTNRLSLVATKVGDETLGPALMTYQDPTGKRREIKSNQVSVKVVEKTGFSLFGKKKKEKEPEPPAEQNQNPTAPAQAPAGDELSGIKPLLPESNMIMKLLWIAILAFIGYLVWTTLRKKKTAASAQPVSTPVQLRDAWKKLGNEDLSGKEFCLGLSSLVRGCLQYKYGFGAEDLTTEEILKILPSHKPSNDELGAAEKILKTCDRVLYADANLTGRDNLRSLCSSILPKAQKP